MPLTLTSLLDLDQAPFDQIIDVRSPAEYAEDHMPGAISLPVLDYAERAQVGTIYKQQDPFTARKLGAALVSRNAARHLEGTLADRPGGWRPLVYCWRGGQRSGSFAMILGQIGWRSDVVEGGYRAYRRLVAGMLHDTALTLRPVLIDGNTGTAKTRLLSHLRDMGGQVVDLEGLAQHRGSLFGAVAGGQPAQKMFESRLAQIITPLDPARPVYIEAESNKIGEIVIPKSLWQVMLPAPRITVAAPLVARRDHLISTYHDLTQDAAGLIDILDRLRPYHPTERIEAWVGQARQGDFAGFCEGLMRDHYDPRYAKSSARRASPVHHYDLPDLGDAALRQTAEQILTAYE
jgi:tRNA 2-selenouridine synthase